MHEKFGRKQDFLQAVLKDWDSVKNDPSAVKKYLEHCPPPSKSIAQSSFVNLISNPLSQLFWPRMSTLDLLALLSNQLAHFLVSQLFLTSQMISLVMLNILNHMNMS